jgi:hypothetical protein
MASQRSARAHQGFQPIGQGFGAFDQKAQIIAQRFCRCYPFLHLAPRKFRRSP